MWVCVDLLNVARLHGTCVIDSGCSHIYVSVLSSECSQTRQLDFVLLPSSPSGHIHGKHNHQSPGKKMHCMWIQITPELQKKVLITVQTSAVSKNVMIC